ncbi:hypothetical protein C8J56DRAFT_886961 [Mycena floridula]|nr:hypothetical protein C8J56DRAFT_886961 [Mycena floridula]
MICGMIRSKLRQWSGIQCEYTSSSNAAFTLSIPALMSIVLHLWQLVLPGALCGPSIDTFAAFIPPAYFAWVCTFNRAKIDGGIGRTRCGLAASALSQCYHLDYLRGPTIVAPLSMTEGPWTLVSLGQAKSAPEARMMLRRGGGETMRGGTNTCGVTKGKDTVCELGN